MRILTFVSQTFNAEETVHIRDGIVDLSLSKLVIDAMDEYGVEEALRLRESDADTEIVALGIGPASIQEALRTVLAIGVNRAIHVMSDSRIDPIAAGSVVAAIAKEEDVDVIFTGCELTILNGGTIRLDGALRMQAK